MAALITFKADVDPKSGVPSRNLTPEAKTELKKATGMDITTTD